MNDINSMTEVYVDISLYTKDAAFGRVSGIVSLRIVPHIGDSISFNRQDGDEQFAEYGQFNGIITVTDRIISANEDINIALALSDVVVENEGNANAIMKFFESRFGLFGEPF